MSRTTKVNHFLAFPLRHREEGTPEEIFQEDMNRVSATTWDMLRHDACYPVSNTPANWIVVCQPYRDGVKGGFTVARWESFGIRGILTSTGPISQTTIPYELLDRIRFIDENRVKVAGMGAKV